MFPSQVFALHVFPSQVFSRLTGSSGGANNQGSQRVQVFAAQIFATHVFPAQVFAQSPGASTVLTLREAVVAWLRSLSPLASIIASRVYFEQPSQLSLYPCVTVKVTARSYGKNLYGADGTSLATVEILPLSLQESSCIAAAEVIRNNCDGFRGTQSGVPILWCKLDDESDDSTPPPDGSDMWIYQVPVNYRIKHRVPLPTSVTQVNV
jgi:hypothetical protein